MKFGVELLMMCEGVYVIFVDGKICVEFVDGLILVVCVNICVIGIEYCSFGLLEELVFFNVGLFYGVGLSEVLMCVGE